MAHSYRKLTEISEDQLISDHDKLSTHTQIGVNYYLDELRRRENNRIASEMNAMTKRIEIATYTAVVIALISLFLTHVNSR